MDNSVFLMQAASPVCVIHGPFGCGKSTLLVALLHYFLAQRARDKRPLKGCRVLVTAHTNVAVDRVMWGLVESGCTGLLPKLLPRLCFHKSSHKHFVKPTVQQHCSAALEPSEVCCVGLTLTKM